MAKIQAVGGQCVVTLTEPDVDGDYGWTAKCGATSTEVRPIDEAIAHAGIHADACGVSRARLRDRDGSIWHLCSNGAWSLYENNPNARWTLTDVDESYGPVEEIR